MRLASLPLARTAALALLLSACDVFGGDSRVVYDRCVTPKDKPQTCFAATETAEGTGAAAVKDAIVDVSYVGSIGTATFDSGRFTMTLKRSKGSQVPSGVIPGFYFGIAGAAPEDIREVTLAPMKVGGRRRVVVPPNLAYGNEEKRGQGGVVTIPSQSTLTFDLTLNSVTVVD